MQLVHDYFSLNLNIIQISNYILSSGNNRIRKLFYPFTDMLGRSFKFIFHLLIKHAVNNTYNVDNKTTAD